MAQKKALLIDANSLIHRAYHALPNLKTSKGAYTGAVYGFLTLFLRIIKEQNPTHVAAAFDLKAPTFRHLMYDGYKGTRKPMDAELAQQFDPLKRILNLMGVRTVSAEGYEADDILGTLSRMFGGESIILTGDRDSFQLVSDRTKVFWTKKGVSEIEVYDTGRLAEDGFTPESFIDYKALRGDPSDNIPGIPGVGEKTAKQLLEQYKTLDEVLNHASELKGKLGESVSNGKESALLSKRLATIKCDVPLEIAEDDLAFSAEYSSEVKACLSEMELNSLIPRMKFVDDADAPRAATFEKKSEEVSSEHEISAAFAGNNTVAVLIGENVTFSFDGDTEYTVRCVTDLFGEGMSFDGAVALIAELCSARKTVCYDYKSLIRKYGFSPEGEFFDIMIAAHLARGSATIKSVEAVLGAEGYDVGAAEIFRYATVVADSMKKQNLLDLFVNVEQPLVPVLAAMEQRGVGVDSEVLGKLKVKYENVLNDLSSRIYEAAGQNFNIASPKQLGEILFDKLGLRHGKKTKTGYSVSEDVLSALADSHPVVGLVLEWRHFSKLLGTYVTGMQPLVNRGRIHTDFNQCITATGRLSSTNPNLQNIPVRGEEAKDVKSAFVAKEGCVLVSADYSQIELRLLAHLSGDERLIDAYVNSEDIHALTASKILGIPQSEVTPSQRREAKAVNFGIIYGMSGFGLAENLSIPQYKAKEFINKYFENYPKVREYLDGCVAFARENGYAVTMLGRRRNLQEITASNYLLRSSAERMAKNTPLQGSAADIVKLAMIAVEKRLKNMRSQLILQIHDELIVEAAEDEAETVARILKEEMSSVAALKVPLIAETAVARTWGELK